MDRSDAWHERVRAWWDRVVEDVVVPVAVLPEITYLLQSRIGPRAEAAFVRAVASDEFVVEALEPEDIARAADLMVAYADFPLGFVDASIVATAERLGVGTLLTTDRRHFSVVRPAHVERLTLVP